MSGSGGSDSGASVREIYAKRHRGTLVRIAPVLEELLRDYCDGLLHIDRIVVRPKSIERFCAKSAKLSGDGTPKYRDPLSEIQDQIGARIIVFYLRDVPLVSDRLERYLRTREATLVEPDADSSFTYFGKHYVLSLPREVIPAEAAEGEAPEVFELQIKTLFQHAWSEAGHDLAYKPPKPLTPLQQRKLAFTSAQAWGADRVYDELYADIFANPGLAVLK